MTVKDSGMSAKCNSGDGSKLFASMGRTLALEINGPSEFDMLEVELSHDDALKLAEVIRFHVDAEKDAA